MKRQFVHNYYDIICLDNLFLAWQEFEKEKKNKLDVQNFSLNLSDNIILLHESLVNFTYFHSGYEHFKISDPKPRDIHKASVRDRLLHHAIYRQLYPFFDKTFIADSYSCRNSKGTHKAVNKFESMANKISKNNTKTAWILKCDIRKFFANIDHGILKNILTQYITDKSIIWLLNRVIDSFEVNKNKGLPLGNLTSQLFVNIYMNEFDQFVKHNLKQKYYIRYADDFVFMSDNRQELISIIPKVKDYLGKKLTLEIHPNKLYLSTLASGVDYLGYVNFPDFRLLRTKTKRRVLKLSTYKNLPSYLGVLKHCDSFKLKQEIENKVGLFE